MLFLLAVLTNVEACPTFTCASIDKGYCAFLDEDKNVEFATRPCPEGTGCSLLSIVNFADSSSAKCTKDITIEAAFDYKARCVERQPNSDLVFGTHPKECSTNNDCQIQNGNFSSCICSFDGASYCQPELSSYLFDFYWEECDMHNGTVTNGKIITLMNLIYSYYVYTIQPPSCMLRYMFELTRIHELVLELIPENYNITDPLIYNYSSNYTNGNDTDEEEEELDSENVGIVLAFAIGLLIL